MLNNIKNNRKISIFIINIFVSILQKYEYLTKKYSFYANKALVLFE